VDTNDPPADGRPPTKRPTARGRPFSQRTEQAIIEATTGLLAERPLSEISLDDIATQARVSKASIYRRWPTKGTLAFDAFMVDFLDRQPLPNTGRLEDDLLATLRNWVSAVDRTATGRALKGLIAEVQRDPALADAWRERFIGPVRARHLLLTERAKSRGELPPGADADLLLDILFGPAYHRLLHAHLPLDESFVRGVVRAIGAAIDAGVF
jgi:AcrR family transcriptional regulator